MSNYFSYTSNPFSKNNNNQMSSSNTNSGGFFSKPVGTSFFKSIQNQGQNKGKGNFQMRNFNTASTFNSNFERSYGFNTSSNNSEKDSTFGVDFSFTSGQIKEHDDVKVTSIMFSEDLKNSNYSLLHMRCQDYIKIIANNNNCQSQLSSELSNASKENHFNINLINSGTTAPNFSNQNKGNSHFSTNSNFNSGNGSFFKNKNASTGNNTFFRNSNNNNTIGGNGSFMGQNKTSSWGNKSFMNSNNNASQKSGGFFRNSSPTFGNQNGNRMNSFMNKNNAANNIGNGFFTNSNTNVSNTSSNFFNRNTNSSGNSFFKNNSTGNQFNNNNNFFNRNNNSQSQQNNFFNQNKGSSNNFFNSNSNSNSMPNNNFFNQNNINSSGNNRFINNNTSNNNNFFNNSNNSNSNFFNKNTNSTNSNMNFFQRNQNSNTNFFNQNNNNSNSNFFRNNQNNSNNFFANNPSNNSFFNSNGNNMPGSNNNNFFNNNNNNNNNMFNSMNNMNSYNSNNSLMMNSSQIINHSNQQMLNSFENLDPNTKSKIAPIINSFVSGLMISMNNNVGQNNNNNNFASVSQQEDFKKLLLNEKSDLLLNMNSQHQSQNNDLKDFIDEFELKEKLRKYEEDNQFNLNNEFKFNNGISVFNQKNKKKKKPKKKNKKKKNPEFLQKKEIFDNYENPNILKQNDFLTVNLIINYENHSITKNNLCVNKEVKCKFFIENILREINLYGKNFKEVVQNCKLFSDENLIDLQTQFKNIKDLEKTFLILSVPCVVPVEDTEKKQQHQKKIKEDELCPESLIPKSTRKDYILSPSLVQFSRMTEKEVQNVKDFSIKNEFGEIFWPGISNLLGLNLDTLIHIKPKSAEVYPDDIYPTENDKPARGTELNKQARITLYNVVPKNDEIENFENILIKMAEEQDCIHVEYNKENNVWIFEVNHFTIYKFDEDIEEDVNTQNNINLNMIESNQPSRNDNQSFGNDLNIFNQNNNFENQSFSNSENNANRNIENEMEEFNFLEDEKTLNKTLNQNIFKNQEISEQQKMVCINKLAEKIDYATSQYSKLSIPKQNTKYSLDNAGKSEFENLLSQFDESKNSNSKSMFSGSFNMMNKMNSFKNSFNNTTQSNQNLNKIHLPHFPASVNFSTFNNLNSFEIQNSEIFLNLYSAKKCFSEIEENIYYKVKKTILKNHSNFFDSKTLQTNKFKTSLSNSKCPFFKINEMNIKEIVKNEYFLISFSSILEEEISKPVLSSQKIMFELMQFKLVIDLFITLFGLSDLKDIKFTTFSTKMEKKLQEPEFLKHANLKRKISLWVEKIIKIFGLVSFQSEDRDFDEYEQTFIENKIYNNFENYYIEIPKQIEYFDLKDQFQNISGNNYKSCLEELIILKNLLRQKQNLKLEEILEEFLKQIDNSKFVLLPRFVFNCLEFVFNILKQKENNLNILENCFFSSKLNSFLNLTMMNFFKTRFYSSSIKVVNNFSKNNLMGINSTNDKLSILKKKIEVCLLNTLNFYMDNKDYIGAISILFYICPNSIKREQLETKLSEKYILSTVGNSKSIYKIDNLEFQEIRKFLSFKSPRESKMLIYKYNNNFEKMIKNKIILKDKKSAFQIFIFDQIQSSLKRILELPVLKDLLKHSEQFLTIFNSEEKNKSNLKEEIDSEKMDNKYFEENMFYFTQEFLKLLENILEKNVVDHETNIFKAYFIRMNISLLYDIPVNYIEFIKKLNKVILQLLLDYGKNKSSYNSQFTYCFKKSQFGFILKNDQDKLELLRLIDKYD